MKKKHIVNSFILILAAVAVILAMTAAVYAFFYREASVPLGSFSVIKDEDGTNVVTIFSANDLEIWAKDDRYENKAEVSAASSRYILVLGADITLTRDIFVDRDVSIALNGKTLDLQSYAITVRHNYAARMVVTAYDRFSDTSGTAGTVTGGGKIYFSVPNGVAVFDEALKSDVYDEEKNPNGHFAADLNESLTVTEIKSRIDTLVRDDDCFIGDLPLVSEVEPYPYRIVWTPSFKATLLKDAESSGAEITNTFLDSDGAVTMPSPSELGAAAFYSVSLGLSYSIERADGTAVADGTGTKNVVLLSEGAADDKIAEGVSFLKTYFAPYRAAGDLEAYKLQLDLGLISKLNYFGLTYSYSVKDTATGENLSSQFLTGTEENGSVTLVYPANIADVTLSVSVTCTYKNGADTVEKTIAKPAEFRFLATDGNNSNQAESLMDSIGALIFTEVGEVRYLIPKENYILYNIADIVYGFENNNAYYSVSQAENPNDGNKIYDAVKMDKAPGYEEKINLVLTITFESGAPATWTVRTQIYYIDPSMGGGGEGSDQFAYYHYLVTNTFLEKTFAGETYLSFTMPTVWLGTVEVKYLLDGSYGAEGAERIRITESEDGTTATFTVDRSLLGMTNETVRLKFKYRRKQEDYHTGWENVVVYGQKMGDDGITLEGEPTVYTFELSGIYHKGTVIGAELFEALYAKYNRSDLDDEPILTYREINDPTVTEIEIGASPVFSDYRGLRYLKYVTSLKVFNSGFGSSAGEDLILMTGLESLEISGADLSDVTWSTLKALTNLSRLTVSDCDLSGNSDLSALNGLTQLSLRNCSLVSLEGIRNLSNLETLNVANDNVFEKRNPNTIRRFDGLYELSALKEFYLYGNVVSDSNFGATGGYNLSELVLLSEKGVHVYRETDGTSPKLFAYTETEREYAYAVQAIVYRNVANAVGGNISLLLPETLPIGSSDSYTFEYLLIPTGNILAFQADGTLGISESDLTAAGISDGGTFEVAVRVSRKNAAAVDNNVWRILEFRRKG